MKRNFQVEVDRMLDTPLKALCQEVFDTIMLLRAENFESRAMRLEVRLADVMDRSIMIGKKRGCGFEGLDPGEGSLHAGRPCKCALKKDHAGPHECTYGHKGFWSSGGWMG